MKFTRLGLLGPEVSTVGLAPGQLAAKIGEKPMMKSLNELCMRRWIRK